MRAENKMFAQSAIRRLPVLVLAVIFTGTIGRLIISRVTAQDTSLSVIKVDLSKTRIIKASGQSSNIENGTYFFASDGKRRIEQTSNGVTRVEIVDFKAEKRIMLDLESKLATVGSPRSLWVAPSSSRRPILGGRPSGMEQASEMVKLGTKVTGGLTLEGTLQTTTFTDKSGSGFVHTFELWAYRFPDPKLVPVILEERFEDSSEIIERRIDAVSTIQDSHGLFEIPTGFTIRVVPR
jgi:hypothetical protein